MHVPHLIWTWEMERSEFFLSTVWSMTKTKQGNDVIDNTGAFYMQMETELS